MPHSLLAWHAPAAVFGDTVGLLLDTPPEILLDLRFAELEAARVAADQVLVELVANARDAALAHRAAAPPRVLLGLHGGSLFLANDGAPFSRRGYLALRRIARSTKRALPSAPATGSDAPQGPPTLGPTPPGSAPQGPLTLGRHGLGFRSVLSVSGCPRIYGHAEDGAPFAIGFGEPRLAALARAAIRADQAACEAALPADEVPWLRSLMDELPLAERSLARHGARGDITADELARDLPVLTFPLAIDRAEAPDYVAQILGWARGQSFDLGSGKSAAQSPSGRPYTTVVVLPLHEADLPGCLDHIEAQIPIARRCLTGTLIRLLLPGAPQSD